MGGDTRCLFMYGEHLRVYLKHAQEKLRMIHPNISTYPILKSILFLIDNVDLVEAVTYHSWSQSWLT